MMVRPRLRILCILSALLLSACASTPPEHFYVLDTSHAAIASGSNSAIFSLTIERITLPEQVDRPQIVLHGVDHEVRFMEGYRWAESLRQALPRVVANDLRRRFPRASIAGANDSTVSAPASYKVAMDVVRFESRLGEYVELVVHWRLRDASVVLRDSISTIRESTDGAGYDALVAAHGNALARLGNDIADAINAANSRR